MVSLYDWHGKYAKIHKKRELNKDIFKLPGATKRLLLFYMTKI